MEPVHIVIEKKIIDLSKVAMIEKSTSGNYIVFTELKGSGGTSIHFETEKRRDEVFEGLMSLLKAHEII